MTDKSLMVGINKYPGCPLNGCVNDITDMAHYLMDHCTMPRANIRLLVDGRATKQAIVDRLHWLVDGAKPGDRLFFHFSGHGVQVPTRNPAGEVDNLDEAICPQNFNWSDDTMIRDKEFNQMFSKVPVGVNFVWVSDSCHSGTLDRSFSNSVPRSMPMPEDISWGVQTAKEAGITTQGMGLGMPGVPLNVALISGCKSNQTSADAFINGRYNGACTYYLLKELVRSPGAPMTQVVTNLNVALRAAHYEQMPQLEGSLALMGKPFMAR